MHVADRDYGRDDLLEQVRLLLMQRDNYKQTIAELQSAAQAAKDKQQQLVVQINNTSAALAALPAKREIARVNQLTASTEELMTQVNDLLEKNTQVLSASPVRTVEQIVGEQQAPAQPSKDVGRAGEGIPGGCRMSLFSRIMLAVGLFLVAYAVLALSGRTKRKGRQGQSIGCGFAADGGRGLGHRALALPGRLVGRHAAGRRLRHAAAGAGHAGAAGARAGAGRGGSAEPRHPGRRLRLPQAVPPPLPLPPGGQPSSRCSPR